MLISHHVTLVLQIDACHVAARKHLAVCICRHETIYVQTMFAMLQPKSFASPISHHENLHLKMLLAESQPAKQFTVQALCTIPNHHAHSVQLSIMHNCHAWVVAARNFGVSGLLVKLPSQCPQVQLVCHACMQHEHSTSVLCIHALRMKKTNNATVR